MQAIKHFDLNVPEIAIKALVDEIDFRSKNVELFSQFDLNTQNTVLKERLRDLEIQHHKQVAAVTFTGKKDGE